LRPDLILLGIGLPTINGIEAARRIRESTPQAKYFCQRESVVRNRQEALEAGAEGYVVKSDAASELFACYQGGSRRQEIY
jgi:DNA-binding response OmpR family regulator